MSGPTVPATYAPTTLDTSNFYIGYLTLAIYYTTVTVALGCYIIVTLFLPQGKCCRERRCICCRPKEKLNSKKKKDDDGIDSGEEEDDEADDDDMEPKEGESYFPYSFPDTRLRRGYIYENSR